MKTSKDERLKQVNSLISEIPVGRKNAFKKLIQYRLAEEYDIVMSESQLSSFLSSGYSTVADTIILAFKDVVNNMVQEEENFNLRIKQLQSII